MIIMLEMRWKWKYYSTCGKLIKPVKRSAIQRYINISGTRVISINATHTICVFYEICVDIFMTGRYWNVNRFKCSRDDDNSIRHNDNL